ncbi:MAG: carboxypeptidase regulatory-like domain-containing protein [Bacteroidia bacterium]|nr:carboxypeptidase regulatory-like domain-containing protein [Bacteroidia bacterium]
MKLFRLTRNLTWILIALLVYTCNDTNTLNNINDPDGSGNIDGPATLSIKLVDDPGDFENLFIEVVDVMIKYDSEDGEEDGGWISMGIIEPGIYDILELTGGVNVPLVENEEIEAGFLRQIRLVLGENNSIIIDGEESPLMTPSAQQSGLKVMVDQEITPNFNYSFILDFVVEESIVIAGNSGNIILKPVLRASLEATTGTISGVVLPGEVAVNVTADDGSIQVTAATDDAGNFLLLGLPPGTYDLSIIPDPGSGYAAASVEGISVTEGENTDVGEIVLELLGSISGSVSPASVPTEVLADNGAGDQFTITPDETGAFSIEGVPSGIYTLTVTPDAGSGYNEAVVDSVEVLAGENTDVGEIVLEAMPGSISGIALPADVIVEIVADNGAGSTGNAATDGASGEFSIADLEPGTYTVTLTPDAASGLTEQIIENVEVLPGQNTDLGEITLE